MTEYKANSHKVREEQKRENKEVVERKKIEPVAKAKTKKKAPCSIRIRALSGNSRS